MALQQGGIGADRGCCIVGVSDAFFEKLRAEKSKNDRETKVTSDGTLCINQVDESTDDMLCIQYKVRC